LQTGQEYSAGSVLQNVSLFLEIYSQNTFYISLVFNVNATSMSTLHIRSCKIFGMKGRKKVDTVSLAQKRNNHRCHASWQYVASLPVIPRAREYQDLLYGAPPQCVGCKQNILPHLIIPFSEVVKISTE
jgi:hypothetical protein